MNALAALLYCENPFSAGRIRPGAMPFLHAAGGDADTLLERLRQNHWWGQIVGGHGTGKSSLLLALIPAIRDAGRQTLAVELHDGQRRLPGGLAVARLRPPAVLLIDGYAAASPWNRLRLKHFCRRRGVGLVVASHRTAGLPPLCQTAIDAEAAWPIVAQLQQGYCPLVTPRDLAEGLRRHEGDLREALFDLTISTNGATGRVDRRRAGFVRFSSPPEPRNRRRDTRFWYGATIPQGATAGLSSSAGTRRQ